MKYLPLILLITVVRAQTRRPPTFAPVPTYQKDPTKAPQQVSIASRSESCPDGSECTPYFLCDDGKIVSRASGLIDVRLNDNLISCPGSLDACCQVDNKVEQPIVTPKETTAECGFRKIDGVGFTIDSPMPNITQFGEFPWTVAVLKQVVTSDGETGREFVCGGSLIHPLVVVTAAHCVTGEPSNILSVRAGEWDTQTESELLPHQDRNIAQVVIHESFEKGPLFNDLAILFLETSFEIAENVKTLCLPPPETDFTYKNCIAAGWGKDQFAKEGRFSVILRKVFLPVIPYDDCLTMLRQTRLSEYFELHNSFLCAGGQQGQDTCKGDGGSPLVCPIPGTQNQYYLAGIVSWGIGCGDSNIPGVYVKVSQFKEWIDMVVREKGLSEDSYTPQKRFS